MFTRVGSLFSYASGHRGRHGHAQSLAGELGGGGWGGEYARVLGVCSELSKGVYVLNMEMRGHTLRQTHTLTYSYRYRYVPVCIHAHAHAYAHVHVLAHRYAQLHAHRYAHVHANARAHEHAHTQRKKEIKKQLNTHTSQHTAKQDYHTQTLIHARTRRHTTHAQKEGEREKREQPPPHIYSVNIDSVLIS